jgi:hypothetical protein
LTTAEEILKEGMVGFFGNWMDVLPSVYLNSIKVFTPGDQVHPRGWAKGWTFPLSVKVNPWGQARPGGQTSAPRANSCW